MRTLVCALAVLGVTGLGGVASAARTDGGSPPPPPPPGVHITPLSDASIPAGVHATGAGTEVDTRRPA
jgi:hypothetical protein